MATVEDQSELTPETPVQVDATSDMVKALSPKQVIAFQHLVAGAGAGKAASSAEVDPSTLYRWTHFNANFRAALNLWSRDQLDSSRLRITAGLDRMVEKLVWKAQNGWDDIAMKFVQGFGVIKPVTGNDSSKSVQQEIDLELQKQQLLLAQQKAELKEMELEHRERRLNRRYRRKRLRKVSVQSGMIDVASQDSSALAAGAAGKSLPSEVTPQSE